MEIGKNYFEPAIPSRLEVAKQALQEIKEIIKQDPQREIVAPRTLTLVQIYAIIERVEEELNLKHQN